MPCAGEGLLIHSSTSHFYFDPSLATISAWPNLTPN